MGLWGNTDVDESRPKWTLDNPTYRANVYATEAGWVYRHEKYGYEELLVCVRGLSTDLSWANIVQFEIIGAPSVAAGSVTVDVVFNETVTVVEGDGITLTVNDGTQDIVLEVDIANSSANNLRFTKTAGFTLVEARTLTVPKSGQNVVLDNGASVKDPQALDVSLNASAMATAVTATVIA